MTNRIAALLLSVFIAAGCGDPVEKDPNISTNATTNSETGDLTGRLRVYDPELREVVELPEGGDLEVVSGFQGGFHVEPRILVMGAEESQLNGTTTFEVRRSAGGEVIATSGQQVFEPLFFQDVEGGYEYFTQPVIFPGISQQSEIPTVLGPALLHVEFELDDGRSLTVEQEVELVDEIDEFGNATLG